MANRSMYRHAPNWFSTLLALQVTETQHTAWRYSDILAVLYMGPFCRIHLYIDPSIVSFWTVYWNR